MVEDDLRITNEIWRKWDEQKITPPMTWQQLWDKVREYIRAGKDPYDILRGPAPSEEWMQKKGFVEAKLPWANPEPEAVVEERELPTFADWLLAAVKRVWETKKGEIYWEWLIEPTERGVLVGLRGVSRPHELFPTDVIEKIKPYHVFPRFRFETGSELETAETILERQGISTRRIDMALMIFGDADYALEVLAERGVDTSRILVERG
jgi:hypothetical protein